MDEKETKEIKETGLEVEEAKADPEETKEELSEEAEEKATEKTMKASTESNRRKKAERREAKAARKEANRAEEKKKRPSNLILGILIFGVLIGMFAFVKGYNYFSKPASIEKYIEENGGEDTYSNMAFDEHTVANVTADGNSMKFDMVITPDEDETEEIEEYKEYYTGEDGQKIVKYYAAYFLTTIKPEVQGFSADVAISVKLNDEEIFSDSMTYKEAKDFLEELSKESEEESEEDAEAEEASDDADDAAEAEAEAAETTDEASEAVEADDAAETESAETETDSE